MGVVVDEHGKPVEQAHVLAIARSDGGPARTIDAVTDAQGRFEFEVGDGAGYEVRVARSDARRSQYVVAKQQVHSGDIDVKLILPAGASIAGRVVLDNSPLPDFGVTVQPPTYSAFGGSPISVHSTDGRLTLRNIATGTWRIAIMGPGTRHKILDDIALENGQSLDVGDIEMEHGDRISGYVRDVSGAPVIGARVMIGRRIGVEGFAARSHLEELFRGEYETTTTTSGEYVFDGVDAHEPGVASPLIWASHPTAGASLLRELPQGDQSIELVVFPTGKVEGIVDGLQGRRVLVFAQRPDEPPFRRRAFIEGNAFHFDDLLPGDYDVSLDVPVAEQVPSARVSVAANQTSEVHLQMTSSTVRLNVRVRGKRASESDIHVELDPPPLDRVINSINMGHEHLFIFQYVKPGNYRISLDGKKTWTDVVVSPSPSEQTIEFSLGI